VADWNEITGRIRDDPRFRRQVVSQPESVPELHTFTHDYRRSLVRYALSVMAHYQERME